MLKVVLFTKREREMKMGNGCCKRKCRMIGGYIYKIKRDCKMCTVDR